MKDYRLTPGFLAGAACWVLPFALLLGCERGSGAQQADESAQRTFVSVCARCHGADGKGGVASPEGSNAPRNFCDTAFQASRSDEQLKLAIRNGKGSMPAFGNAFTEAELQGLVHKIRSLDPSLERP